MKIKRVAAILGKPWVFVVILSSVLIFTAFVPFIYQIMDTPAGSVFIGTHNNALDYPVFISEIIQASRGRWTFLAKYTTEEQIGTLVHPLYIPLGKIAGIFNINPVVMYHLGRLATAFIFAFTVYYFICYVFSDERKRLLAFFLCLFSAGFLTSSGPNLAWWSGGDVFGRAVFLPHGVLKNILLLLILVWMGKLFENGKKKYLVWSCTAGLFLGLLDPMNTMAIWGVVGIYLISHIGLIRQIRFIRNILIYFLFSGVALVYTKIVFDVTPWSVVKAWEANQIYSVNFWEYANHIGITFYLGVIGVFLILKKYKNFISFAVLFLTIPTIIFIVTNAGRFVGLSGLRFFQIPVYVFLAMGSAYLLIEIFNFFSKKYLKILVVLFCGLIVLISFPMYRWSLNNQMKEFTGHWGNIYVDKNLYEAGLWLKENTLLDSNVMASYMAGMVLVAISGNNVYIGHPVSTINFETKKVLTDKFFSGQMGEAEALKMILEGRVDYVFVIFDEEGRIDAKKYKFLKKIHEGNGAAVYEVLKS